MDLELNIILAAETKWFMIWGPVVVYIIIEIISGGDGGFGGGSDDGFSGF
tara:strand:- start:37 stop:186 length:150 start_codon:yes stop_codon:yes gene_type:complete